MTVTVPNIAQIPLPGDAPDTFDQKAFDLWPQVVASIDAMNLQNVENNDINIVASSALAAANYKGLWASLSGALNRPASVYHSGLFWVLNSDLADVTLATPGVSAAWTGTGMGALSNDIIDPRDFGAVGNGVIDDTAALVAAIEFGRLNRRVLDGGGRVYKVSSQITAVPWRVQNLTLDASGQSSTGAWLVTGAEFESSKVITVNTIQGARQFSVTGHGFSVGDVVLATSALVIETGTSSRAAHWGNVSVVTSNTFLTDQAAGCNIMTANTPIVRRLPVVECRLSDVKIIGGPNCKAGFVATRFTKVELIRCSAVDTLDRGFGLVQCADYYVSILEAVNCSTDGLGYGLAISGCGPGRVDLARGWRCRHVVTYGASGTIPCTGGSIGDVQGFNCLGAALDTHPAVFGFTQTGWTQADMATLAGEDGITWQAVGGSFRARLTGSMLRHAALIQPMHVSAAFSVSPVFSAEVVCAGGSSDRGLIADVSAAGSINSIDLNFIGRSTNECVSITAGAQSIEHIKYSGSGVSTAGRALRTLGAALTNVRFITQGGHWVAAVAEATYHFMGTDASVRTTLISVPDGSGQGGTYGLRVGNKASAIVGAAFFSGSTAASVANPAPATITTLN